MKSPRSLLIMCVFYSCCSCSPSQRKPTRSPRLGQKITSAKSERLRKSSPHALRHRQQGQPTFLNLDDPYPKEVFTISIWGSERVRGTAGTVLAGAEAIGRGFA